MVFVQTCEQTASSEEIHAVMGLAGGAGKGKERGVCLRNRVDERIDVTAGEPDTALIPSEIPSEEESWMVGRGAEGCAESRTYKAGGWEGDLRQGKE